VKDEEFRKYKPCHPVWLLVDGICVIPRASWPPRGAARRKGITLQWYRT